MKKTLLLTITLLSVCTLFAQNYQSLDLKNPIQFSGNKIIYNSETITLDEHNIFLAGNLSDEEIKGKSFVFNNFADAVAYFDTDTVEVLRATPLQYTIYIAPFVYWIDNPDDPEIRKPNPDDTKKYGRARPYGMTIKTNNLHLRGLTENPENIVLASNRGQTQGAEGNFTMFHFLGDDLKVSNLTMGNYCNVDLEFPLKPELNRTKRNNAIVQAQIAICEGDRIWAESVRFISRLNLNPLSTQKRSFFHNCYFESTDDALAPTGVYLGCIFKFFSSKPFAQTRGAGAVILDSDIYIVGKRKTQYMVKRNSPLALVDVRFHADDDSVQIGWIQKTDIDPEHIYYQYNVTLNGKPVILNGNTVDMTGKEVLDAYLIDESGKGKIYNVPNLLNEWEPIKYKAMSMPNSFNIKHIIPYCSKNYQYDVNSKNINLPLIYPKVASSIFFEDVEKTIIETGKDTIILQANVNRSYPVNKVKFLVDKENINFVKLIWKDNICKVIPTNHSDETREVIIYATTESGLKAARKIIVKPPTLPAPTFIREPKIVRKGNELIVDYKLDLQGGTRDESEIMWLREDKIYEDSDSVLRILLPIFISRNENRAKIYPLTKADADKRISVIVTPKSNRSEYGFLDMTSITIPEKYKSKLSENINTDFSNFPDKGFSNHYLKLNLPPKKGFWTITEHRPEGEFAEWKATNDSISPWSYGFGFDGAANAEGLYQNRRGARLVYTPVEDSYGDMSLTTVLAPCKSAGQGFGSATGQYLDIYIKYDTETMTGYGLRIVRTPDNDRSVNMVLMQYEKGVAKPISESITTSVYRTNCTVSLSVKGDTLTATAITDAVYTDNRPNVARVVGAENFPPLQAKITPNKFGGIGFQHTGTGNTNATVITHLKVDFGK